MGTSRHDNEALEERLLEFAARCGRVVESLPDTRVGRHVAGQFVRCGTAAAPNYAEACAAESRNDFVHKLGIALKELQESRIWLKLAIKCELLPSARLLPLVAECNELMGIIGQSIITAKSNRRGHSTRESRSG